MSTERREDYTVVTSTERREDYTVVTSTERLVNLVSGYVH